MSSEAHSPRPRPLYDTIGTSYGTTRRADPEIARALARFLGVGPGLAFLDLACGTGNYTCALAALGGSWHGIDLSEEMLRQARPKSSAIVWTHGRADALPYPDCSFDGVLCTLAIHHFDELVRPFREVYRVLRRGRFVIFTSFPEQMRSYWLCRYFPKMMERAVRQMPERSRVFSALEEAGFAIDDTAPFHVTPGLEDLFLYSGKDHPERYFDPTFRANISSFAALCPPEELSAGLASLRADIDHGAFPSVHRSYSSDAGDYAFVVAAKSG